MSTIVGNEENFTNLIRNLILLEHDAIAAYDSTIERLEDAGAASKIAEFRQDHQQHLDVLHEIALQLGLEPPTEGDMKQMLTTGKIMLAKLAGDGAILKAMKTNEDDTVTAYDRAKDHREAKPETRAFFQKALSDELRHRDWMETMAERSGS